MIWVRGWTQRKSQGKKYESQEEVMRSGYLSSILSSIARKDIFNRSVSFPRVIFIGVRHICNKFQGILIINLLMSKLVTIIVCLLVGQLAFALHLEAEASATATAAKVSTPGTQNTANAQPAKSKLTEEAKEENAEAIAGRDFEVQPIPVVANKASGSEGKKNKLEGEKEKEEEKKEQKEEEKEQEKEQEKEEEKKEHKLKEEEKEEEKSEEEKEQAEEEQGHYPHSKQEERLLELQKELYKEKEKYQLLKSFLQFQAEQQIRQKLHKFQAEQEGKHHKDHQNHKILRQEEEQEEKEEQEEAEKKQKKDEHYQKQGVQIQKKLVNGIQSGVETGVKDVLNLINAPHGIQKAHETAKTANHLSQE